MAYDFPPYTHVLQTRPTGDFRDFEDYRRLMDSPNPLNCSIGWLPYVGRTKKRRLKKFKIKTIGDLMDKVQECDEPNNFHYWLLAALRIRNYRNDVTVFSVITTLMEINENNHG